MKFGHSAGLLEPEVTKSAETMTGAAVAGALYMCSDPTLFDLPKCPDMTSGLDVVQAFCRFAPLRDNF
jgi:hypothetical protein